MTCFYVIVSAYIDTNLALCCRNCSFNSPLATLVIMHQQGIKGTNYQAAMYIPYYYHRGLE